MQVQKARAEVCATAEAFERAGAEQMPPPELQAQQPPSGQVDSEPRDVVPRRQPDAQQDAMTLHTERQSAQSSLCCTEEPISHTAREEKTGERSQHSGQTPCSDALPVQPDSNCTVSNPAPQQMQRGEWDTETLHQAARPGTITSQAAALQNCPEALLREPMTAHNKSEVVTVAAQTQGPADGPAQCPGSLAAATQHPADTGSALISDVMPAGSRVSKERKKTGKKSGMHIGIGVLAPHSMPGHEAGPEGALMQCSDPLLAPALEPHAHAKQPAAAAGSASAKKKAPRNLDDLFKQRKKARKAQKR